MKKARISLLTGLVVLVASRSASADKMTTSPEQAYDLGEIPSARAVGMGGALNALGVSTTGLYLNPANMALARVYHLEALGAYSPEAQRETFGLAIEDSVISSSHLAGGLAATYNQMDPNGLNRTWTDVRVALALPVASFLAIGTTVRWLRVDQNVAAGPFGPSYASDGTSSDPIFNSLTFDVGATASIGGLRIGAVGHNLTNTGSTLAPTTAGGGIGYATDTLAIEADGMADFTTYGSPRGRFMVGGEAFVADHIALRAGYRYDGGTTLSSPSLGVGYVDPKWSIELGVRRDIVSQNGETFGVISLRYFYDPTGGGSSADEPDPF